MTLRCLIKMRKQMQQKLMNNGSTPIVSYRIKQFRDVACNVIPRNCDKT